MRAYALNHLSDDVLTRDLDTLALHEHGATAWLVAHIAEVDARRLYLKSGYESMYQYCVRRLRFCEQAALKRIRAGRTARRFPEIFDALADGRLHLSAVVLLTPYLAPENADELIAAATHRTKAEIEQLLARRFPKPDVPARVVPIAPPPWLTSASNQLSPGTVESEQVSPGTVEADPLAPPLVEVTAPRPKVAPLSSERFALQVTIGKSTHEKLRYAQDLLGHSIRSGDIAQVIDKALDALIGELEKRKFAATRTPRPRSRRSNTNPRHVPAHVKRAVWERDRGQCTFVGDTGHRCAARKFLEFDHRDPVARGGQATVECVRLRCRGHNQFEAERTFGADFMRNKRQEAQRAAAEKRAKAAAIERANEIVPCLRNLGFRADEVRRAVELCATMPAATLEERVRAGLNFLCPNARSRAESGRDGMRGPDEQERSRTPMPTMVADSARGDGGGTENAALCLADPAPEPPGQSWKREKKDRRFQSARHSVEQSLAVLFLTTRPPRSCSARRPSCPVRP